METKQKLRFSKIYKKWYILLATSLVLTGMIYLISRMSFFQETELKLIDYRFRLSPQPEMADSNVVIIAIDDGSLEFFKNNGISWPWPRSYYAYVVDFFTACGSEAVIFDMQFYEPDIDREETDAEVTDGAFAAAMKENGGVILGIQLSEDSLSYDTDLSRFDLTVNNPLETGESKYNGLIAPLDIFLEFGG